MTAPFHPYLPRRIAPVGLPSPSGWHLKGYAISADGSAPSREGLAALEALARTVLQGAADTGHHHAAFCFIHEARAFNTIAIDWWVHENELRHRFYRAAAGTADYEEITATGPTACVWEIAVQAFERDAWVRHLLAESASAAFEGWSEARLSGWV